MSACSIPPCKCGESFVKGFAGNASYLPEIEYEWKKSSIFPKMSTNSIQKCIFQFWVSVIVVINSTERLKLLAKYWQFLPLLMPSRDLSDKFGSDRNCSWTRQKASLKKCDTKNCIKWFVTSVSFCKALVFIAKINFKMLKFYTAKFWSQGSHQNSPSSFGSSLRACLVLAGMLRHCLDLNEKVMNTHTFY